MMETTISIPTPLAERLRDAHAAGEHWVTTEGLVALAERHERYRPTPGVALRLKLAHALARKALDRFCDLVRLCEYAGLSMAESDALMLEYQGMIGDCGPVGVDQAPGWAFPRHWKGGVPC